jgi:glycerate 2-kinase
MSTNVSPRWCDHRRHLHALATAALGAVDPFQAVSRCLRLEDGVLYMDEQAFPLRDRTRIFVVGAGKAGFAMSRAMEEILGDWIEGGVVAVPYLPPEPLHRIRLIKAGHPLPDDGSIEAGRKIKALLQRTRIEDLVLALISGGGSALLELPVTGLHLIDLQRLNDLLIRCGAPIQEMNAVRRQVSMIKGGGLVRMAAPATTFALILSDVIGDHPEAIASGPTSVSQTTREDAREILKRYDLLEKVPRKVLTILETPSHLNEGDQAPTGARVENLIIGSNRIAARAAVMRAKELGFRPILLTTRLQGEAREIGRWIGALVKSMKIDPSLRGSPICIVLGGETTVTVRGDGIGGRNQELALSAAIELDGWGNVAMMTLATDGVDGPTPAAGAIVTGETLAKARQASLNALSFLEWNDSHTFFHALGDAVTLGPTGTNVNDLVFCVVYGFQGSG